MRRMWPVLLGVLALCALIPLLQSAGAPGGSESPVEVKAVAEEPEMLIENSFDVTQGIDVEARVATLQDGVDIPATALAPGLSLDSTGAIRGAPTTPGSYSRQVRLCHRGVCVEEQVTVVVHPNIPWRPGVLTFSGQVGAAMDSQITVIGGPELLPTVTIGPDGHVGGTPLRTGVSKVPVRICVAGNCGGVVVTLIVV